MTPLIISLAAFVGVAALVGGVALMFRGPANHKLEDRLDVLAGLKKADGEERASLMRDGSQLGETPGVFEVIVNRFGKLAMLFEQADTTLTPAKFFLISTILGAVAAVVSLVLGCPVSLVPLAALATSTLPLIWLVMRRKRRLAAFAAQLPDALELIARALRAGHSLASGLHLVAEEMADPIGAEFERVFEEQNLGVPLEEALQGICDRVPNLDLKFFVTAVVLQRQTGGDLAEILDKIGYLIRERFRIWGQVQALTGEGRLSGIVLLGLPPLLFLAVYYLNPGYVMVLFTDPMGKQMLAGAVVMQVIGAWVIRKIVNIKV